MERIPEPELMDDEAQALAYARADFEIPHNQFIERFQSQWPSADINGSVIDLGCGPADISVRFARAYPHCTVLGVDGAKAMLAHGLTRIQEEGLQEQITLEHRLLPDAALPSRCFQTVISNSLLHHLHQPQILWQTINQCAAQGAQVFVMDLMRPESEAIAEQMMNDYVTGEPEILQHDFYHSLLAAFTLDEVSAQLQQAGLAGLEVKAISDRHLLVAGRIS